MSRIQLDMSMAEALKDSDDGQGDTNTGDTGEPKDGESVRQYIGRIQRENADLRNAATKAADTNSAQSTNSGDKGSNAGNAGVTTSDLTLNATDAEVEGFNINTVKQQIMETGAIPQTSLDLMSKTIQKGMTPDQAGQVTALLTDTLMQNSANTASRVNDILGGVSYKDTIKPWAQTHARKPEWDRGLKSGGWESTLRDMKREYDIANPSDEKTTDTDGKPTNIDGDAGGGNTQVDDNKSPEDRGYFKDRADKTRYFATIGQKYRVDAVVRAKYDKLVNASMIKGTI